MWFLSSAVTPPATRPPKRLIRRYIKNKLLLLRFCSSRPLYLYSFLSSTPPHHPARHSLEFIPPRHSLEYTFLPLFGVPPPPPKLFRVYPLCHALAYTPPPTPPPGHSLEYTPSATLGSITPLCHSLECTFPATLWGYPQPPPRPALWSIAFCRITKRLPSIIPTDFRRVLCTI